MIIVDWEIRIVEKDSITTKTKANYRIQIKWAKIFKNTRQLITTVIIWYNFRELITNKKQKKID